MREAALLTHVAEFFTEEELRPPNGYLDVLKSACDADGLDLDAASVERLWRAASGAAHGMYWPNLELQRLTVGDEYEPGHFRARSLPDSAVMVDVIEAAYKMSRYAALKYLLFSENITLKPDVDPELFLTVTRLTVPLTGQDIVTVSLVVPDNSSEPRVLPSKLPAYGRPLMPHTARRGPT